MLRARHRRRSSTLLLAEEWPRLWIRFGIGIIVLFIIWYIGTAVVGIFSRGGLGRESADLKIEGDNVRVTLQDGEELRAQDGLKMYEGDVLSTQYGGNATLTFFDGTRVRLDERSKLTIEENQFVTDGTSSIKLALDEGRAWVETSPASVFTGAITRMVDLGIARVTLPATTIGLLSKDLLFFISADGIGADIDLRLDGEGHTTFVLGEGQSFALTQEARRALESGQDPYNFRDPVHATMLGDAFVAASRRLLAQNPVGSGMTIGTNSGIPEDDDALLSVTTPVNDQEIAGDTVTVAGRVSSRVRSITVNDYSVTIKNDGTFSQELALPNETEVMLRVEAADEAGITLAEVSRTIIRRRDPLDAPTITAPGISGATVRISEPEVEIRGTAPARAAGIIVNEYRLQLFKPGASTWSYLASTKLGNLKAGENHFVVQAINSAGAKSAPARITIVVGDETALVPVASGSSVPALNNAPLTPGILTVTAPAAGTSHSTKETEILIEGKTSPETDSIWVNDYRLQLYAAGKDFWNYIASVELQTMKRGTNTYTVVARNAKGEVLDRLVYTINFEP